MLRIDTMEEERLLFDILTPEISKRVKQQILDVLEDFGKQRAI